MICLCLLKVEMIDNTFMKMVHGGSRGNLKNAVLVEDDC